MLREAVTRDQLFAAIAAEGASIAKREGTTLEQGIERYVRDDPQGVRLHQRYKLATPGPSVVERVETTPSERAFGRLARRAAEEASRRLEFMSSVDVAMAVDAFVQTEDGRRLQALYDEARESEYQAALSASR